MKASKLLTKEQRCKMYGEWIRLKLNFTFTFEQFLTQTIKLDKKNLK